MKGNHPSLFLLCFESCLCGCPGKGEDTYPDLLALFIALLVTVIIALGVRNSVGFNNILNVVNMVVWVFMIIAGLFFITVSNWEGGKFLPYGWSGVRRCSVQSAWRDLILSQSACKSPHLQLLFGISVHPKS